MANTSEPFPDLPGERFYSVKQVCEMFAGRSRRWVEQRAKAGEFGTILEAGGWLIPLSGLRRYVREHAIAPGELSPVLQDAASNLVQFRKSE